MRYRIMRRHIGNSLFLLATAVAASAATGYVATDGKPENDGSRAKPWPSVEHALSRLGGGHTIIVRPGVYRGPIQIAKQFAGTRERPTVTQSEVKWKAVIVGAEVHGISNSDGCDWVTIDGFEVLGARYDGIKMNGNHNAVRNCWVHNNQAMGVAMHKKRGGLIENNTVVEQYPLTLWNGNREIVANNILVSEGQDTFSFNEGTTNVLVDYNLCAPKSARNGPHGVTGDPLFVDAGKGLFWLRAESPARRKGASEHAPATDLWGRPRSRGQPPDLGAMPFMQELLKPEVRGRFEYGWTCYRHGTGGTLPDFWALPSKGNETSTP
jgi:hypothetical protein